MKRFFNKLLPDSKQRRTVFVDTQQVILDDEMVDIILSPRFYWSRFENLPVKYARSAKAYAKGYFDRLIPEGEYSYKAQKSMDGFYLYAYQNAYILDTLANLGVDVNKVGRIYFAQSEFASTNKALQINPHEALISTEGNVIKVPLSMVEGYIPIEKYIQSTQRSDFFITLNKYNRFISNKHSMAIISCLSLLLVFYAVEFFTLKSSLSSFEEKKEQIHKKYNLLSTSMQTQAVLKNLEKKMNLQLDIRNSFYTLTRLPLGKDDHVNEIEYKNLAFELDLHLANPKELSKIQAYLKKYFKSVKIISQNQNEIKFHLKEAINE